MKKLIFLLFSLLLTCLLTAQQPLYKKYHDLPESTLKTGTLVDFPRKIDWYDWSAGIWIAKATQSVVYNESGYRLTEVIDSISGTDLKYVYTYNQDNKVTEIQIQALIAGGWVPDTRTRYEYDSKGAQSLMMIERYTDGTWVTQMGVRYDHEYNGDLLYRETTILWNNSTQSFVNFWRFTYTYNSGVLESDINEIYSNGTWKPYFRETHFWLSKDKRDYVLFDQWKGTAWTPDVKETYRYYGEMNLEVIDNKWDPVASNYFPMDRFIEEFDAHQNPALFTWEGMNTGAWVLLEGERYTMAYEGEHALSRISETSQADSTGNPQPWMKNTKEVYSDFFNLGTNPITAEAIGITCYPNPAGDQTMVKIILSKAGTFLLSLYSLTGQKVFEENVSSNGTEIRYQLNLTNILPGSYLVVASDKYGSELGKTRILKH
jgi:hypothetical protein